MDRKKALEISEETKRKVLERQRNQSVTGRWLSKGNVNFHHVVSKGASGVGYEFNVVALTPDEHRKVHDGNKTLLTLCRNHLIIRYPKWSEKGVKYHKGWEEEDYGIVRGNL